MPKTPPIDRLLRRDRMLVIGGLSGVVLLSWLYLLAGGGMDMSDMREMAMPMAAPVRSLFEFGLLFAMWAVMMAAMMLPSAAPMILFYAMIARRRHERGEPTTAAGVFALGYVALWAAFSLIAAALQQALEQAALLSPMMSMTNAVVVGLLLIAAGLYQWTPLKDACLRQCRSPLDFVLAEWREGARGALVMGVRHGLYCLGCCWALMLLLFVGGVMNPLWIGGLALIVLVEKTAPAGGWIARAAGAALVVWGGLVLSSLA